MDGKILLVAGARPNFMKIAPLWREFRKYPETFQVLLIHTGQHYDAEMSDFFFRDLGLVAPDRFLGVGVGSHAEQTGKIMMAFEQVCVEEQPDLVVVVGDVNSTMACAITAKKLGIPVAHVESGLRSRDWTMPEEINRIVTDALSDYLFTPSRDADANLLREGVPHERIHFVGNIMIDALSAAKPKAEQSGQYLKMRLKKCGYGLVTLHRPSNVDKAEAFRQILDALSKLSVLVPIVFPIHPRTRKNLKVFGLDAEVGRIASLSLLGPLGYWDFVNLEMHAAFVITDSGGVQEETTWFGVPCLTLRKETERPITISEGTNELISVDSLPEAAEKILNGCWKQGRIPELWDGKTAQRIVNTLMEVSL